MAGGLSRFHDAARDGVPLLLQSLLDRGSRVQPENLIVTRIAEGYAELTFQQHQQRTLQLGSALTRWGVQLGDCIGTLIWNTAWHIQCAHAVSCIGCVFHALNARLSPGDVSFTVAHAKDRVIFVDACLLDLLGSLDPAALFSCELFVCCGSDGIPGAWAFHPSVPRAKCKDYEDFLAMGSAAFVWPSFPETTPHSICYTSGTTSKPKGVVYSHRSTYLALMAMGLADQYGITGDMVVSSCVPMFHILSWGVPLLTLMLGARTILPNRYNGSDDLLDMWGDWMVEWTAGVPAVWQAMREAIQRRGVDMVQKQIALRKVLSGGSAPTPEVMDWYHQTLGVEFMQGWGMTETNPLGTNAKYVSTYRDRSKDMAERYGNLRKAGICVPGFEVRIADPNDLSRDTAPGVAGELLVRGPLVITRYFQGEAPEKFHDGWLITGDVARIDLDDGAVVISDRSKDFIKSGGEWISSIALEAHIAALQDVVGSVAVVGVPHPRWDERPVAIVTLPSGGSQLRPPRQPLLPLTAVTLSDGCSANAPASGGLAEGADLAERIRAHCLEAFARFQVPDDVIVWEALPLNSTGKVDKAAIRRRLKDAGYVLPSFRGGAVISEATALGRAASKL